MQNVSEVYHAQYQCDSVSEKALDAYGKIARVLTDTFAPKNAVDIGCGGGALVRGLHSCGVDAIGLEGSQHAVDLLPDRIELCDLRVPLAVRVTPQTKKFDLVCCFDVGEHIEPEFAVTFAENIRYFMKRDSILVFGAAPEGQDGLGHVNCQHPAYWIEKLFPLELLPGRSEQVRAAIKAEEGTNFLWWVAKNLMVFKHA